MSVREPWLAGTVEGREAVAMIWGGGTDEEAVGTGER